jgi:hypothetical protein
MGVFTVTQKLAALAAFHKNKAFRRMSVTIRSAEAGNERDRPGNDRSGVDDMRTKG